MHTALDVIGWFLSVHERSYLVVGFVFDAIHVFMEFIEEESHEFLSVMLK